MWIEIPKLQGCQHINDLLSFYFGNLVTRYSMGTFAVVIKAVFFPTLHRAKRQPKQFCRQMLTSACFTRFPDQRQSFLFVAFADQASLRSPQI